MPKPKKHNKTLFEFDAIGTHWWCESLEDNCVFDNKLATALLQRAAQFDADYTRFADTGYIGQLNKTGVVHHAPKELIDMLAFAKELYEASEGAFNISVGGALHAAGYGAPQRTARIWANPWPDIVVKKSTITIPQDMTLDLGGLGKGWLIDELLALCRAYGMSKVLINGGGDMLVANSELIEIALEHPLNHTKMIGTTKLKNQALAVSGNTKRRWADAEGNEHVHIIDPMGSKTDVAGTFVKADTARVADALATILIMRPELKDRLERQYKAKAIVVR